MTIKVKIEHTQKGYEKSIQVFSVLPDGTRLENQASGTLNGGEAGYFYVHSGQSIIIDEFGAETKATNFGYALKALKEGKKVARLGWNGKGMFLFLVPGSQFAVNRATLLGIYPAGQVVDYAPHIDMKTADDKIVPWVASQTDVLAEDWCVLA